MKVRIKRIDKDLPLPRYETAGACGFDLVIREDKVVEPNSPMLLPTNIIVEVPEGYMLAILPRSSMVKKTGLIVPNGTGVLDQDYHGPTDEAMLLVYNPTDEPIKVKRGDRLGQGVFVRVDTAEWEESDENLKSDNRGGYGSTN